MGVSAGTLETITCGVLISVNVIGNMLLIYSTKRCISEYLRTSFILIFSLAMIHLANNLVNALKIVDASDVGLNLVHCKILKFTTIFTTSLAIWFTLYIALLYCFKLCRVLHPPAGAASTTHRKCHLVLVFTLWITGFAVCAPILPYTGRTGNLNVGNETFQQNSSLIDAGKYAECKTEYSNYRTEIFYGRIFLVAIDALPLIIILLVSFRILHLLWEYKKATHGGIWFGDYTIEVLRACKVILPLTFLVTSLWISHFILIYCLKDFHSNYFAPPVLTVLSSGYSATSPYLLMLINYKVQVKVQSFCCEKKSSSVSPSVCVSPYA
ncbi:uncharacterized protein LOC128347165 [Hemicordylus capensis]|uniref:uncharacterized protein LOC128347165 n=1 Tax=Hemicordylus capensis TaxID=884348 RepID=UPI00230386DC|nr:uncharacterized protein LOC128347165 [Hemicordylus capensis]